MTIKRLAQIGLLALTLLAPGPAMAWGPAVHQAVTAKAIDTLPGPIKDFYKAHRLELPTLALEPTFPDEGLDRRFAVDRVMPYPFTLLPRSEAEFKARFGDPPGRLPWLIQESYARLVQAFKAGDKAQIIAESDALAGLVTDLNNPLALTDNADGQKTDQHGLWVRFTDKLPESLGGKLKLEGADAAVYLDDPDEYAFSIIKGTYVWVDNVLYGDELANRSTKGYSEAYYEFLNQRSGAILSARLGLAARDVGSYWYTAWVNAGKPALK